MSIDSHFKSLAISTSTSTGEDYISLFNYLRDKKFFIIPTNSHENPSLSCLISLGLLVSGIKSSSKIDTFKSIGNEE